MLMLQPVHDGFPYDIAMQTCSVKSQTCAAPEPLLAWLAREALRADSTSSPLRDSTMLIWYTAPSGSSARLYGSVAARCAHSASNLLAETNSLNSGRHPY